MRWCQGIQYWIRNSIDDVFSDVYDVTMPRRFKFENAQDDVMSRGVSPEEDFDDLRFWA